MALLCLRPNFCSDAPGGSLLSGPTLGPPRGTLPLILAGLVSSLLQVPARVSSLGAFRSCSKHRPPAVAQD